MTTRAKIGVVAGGLAVACLFVAAFLTPARPEWVSAVAASLSALAAVVTSIVGIAALGQVRRDSQSATRPVVGAWLRKGGAHGYIDLAVRNFGESVAHDVQVDVVGLPDWASQDPVLSRLVHRYENPIPTLVPGFDLSNTYASPWGSPAPRPPDTLTINISYRDDQGRKYNGAFVLDVNLIMDETWVQEDES